MSCGLPSHRGVGGAFLGVVTLGLLALACDADTIHRGSHSPAFSTHGARRLSRKIPNLSLRGGGFFGTVFEGLSRGVGGAVGKGGLEGHTKEVMNAVRNMEDSKCAEVIRKIANRKDSDLK